MKATANPEWKFTSFSSYLKTLVTKDLPVCAVAASIFFGGNYFAERSLDTAVYSKLTVGFDVGMGYLGLALLGFFTLVFAFAFGASLYAGFYRRQPMAVWLRMGVMSLVVTIGCEWAFIHALRGDLGTIVKTTATLFGL
jgi:hypothetical protein